MSLLGSGRVSGSIGALTRCGKRRRDRRSSRSSDALVAIGALTRFDLTRVLADHLGVPFVDLQAKQPDPLLTQVLPEEVARRYNALAITRAFMECPTAVT